MSCPRCSAKLDSEGICGSCAAEPDIGSSKTMQTPVPLTSSTAAYSPAIKNLSNTPGLGPKSKQKTIDASRAMSVSETLLGSTNDSALALSDGVPVDVRETSVSVNSGMIGEVLGSYRVLDVLGEGGMGRVYLAEHVKIGRRVALKMLHSHLAQSAEVVSRFFDEARAVNRILHEHIVEITDFVENEKGNNYFIMEHLKGAPLSDVMEIDDDSSPISRCLAVGVQVASALSAVHAANIVHRDLKPENIFLTQRGGQEEFVKLLDFGIAKLLGDDGGGMKLRTTQAGVIMGTPDYMSPEQASAAKVDFRTDIYSLGVILYELCTGQLPFKAETFGDLIFLHKTKKPLKPSKVPGLVQSIPAPLEELILDCLNKDPGERPQSAKEVEDRLNEISWGFAVELEHFELTGDDGRRGGRRGVLIGVGGLVAAAATLTFALTRGEKKAPPVPLPVAEAPIIEIAEAPVTATAPAAKVSLSFLSDPPGAMVYSMGEEEELLGVTPFTGSFQKSVAAMNVEFRHDGFLTNSATVTPDKRGSLRIELVAEAPQEPTAEERRLAAKRRRDARATKEKDKAKAKGRGFKEGAVMDPFAKK